MKKINLILITLLSFVLFTGCDEGFEELNVDPNKSTAAPAHLLLGTTQRIYANVIYNAQAGGDMGECWAQHWSKVQYNEEARYVPRRVVIDGVWNNLYASVIAEAKSMYDLADAEGNNSLKGAALVMQAVAYQSLVELYGPIPFTEAITGGVLQPAYDDEAVVFEGVIDMLTSAANLLNTGTGEITASSDLFYGGDVSKWYKFANSLKFRALMRISSTRNVNSELQALMGKMFTSNNDSAQIAYLAAQPDANPIYETIVFGSRAEYKVNSVLVSTLTGLNDPRLTVYAGENADGDIVGKPSGFGAQTTLPNEGLGYTYANISPLGDFYLEPTLPGVVISYSQVCFLIAEAMNEGFVAGGIAASLDWYKKGIQANLDFNEVPTTDALSYLAQSSLNYASQADGRTKIATQVWIALYGQGFETWTEWRRTKIPALTPAAEAVLTQIPSRFFYPTTEPSLNKTSYDAAVSKIGADELTSPLFWQ